MKNAFVGWLYKEKALRQEDNVYYAPRAFVANSLVRWCLLKRKRKEIDDDQADRYARLALRYIKKELDLWWDNGIINMSFKVKEDSEHGSDSMEN